MAGMKPFHLSPSITPASPMSMWAPWTHGIFFDPDDDGGGDGGQGGGENTPPPGGGGDGGEPKPPTTTTFTQEQVNAITQQRLERERKQAEEDRKRLLSLAGAESIEDLEKRAQERENAKKEQLRKEKKYEELIAKQNEEWEAERQKYQSELQQLRTSRASELKTRALVEAANANDAISASQVARLLSDRVMVTEEGALAVVDANGEVELGDDMKPLPVAKLVEKFLNDNKHFQKGAGGAGANSTGSSGGGPNPPASGGGGGSQGFDYNRALKDPEYAQKNYDQFIAEAQRMAAQAS